MAQAAKHDIYNPQKNVTVRQYWLMKSEPDVFSFADLKVKKRTLWDGVRNYLARNYMLNEMRLGDQVLFYHSNAKPSGVAGLAVVSGPARPDHTAFDPLSNYYDEKSKPDSPRWFCVEIAHERDFRQFVSLEAIKKNKKLKHMVLLQNSRLSVQPVTVSEFQEILKMAEGEYISHLTSEPK